MLHYHHRIAELSNCYLHKPVRIIIQPEESGLQRTKGDAGENTLRETNRGRRASWWTENTKTRISPHNFSSGALARLAPSPGLASTYG